MAILNGNVTDDLKAPVVGANVYLYDSNGQLATLTDAAGAPLDNPVQSGTDGYWEAYATTGVYRADTYYAGRLRFRERLVAGQPAELKGDTGAQGPAGTLLNNSGVVTTVPASTAGQPRTVGHTISMPASGTGQDVGLLIDGGSGTGSGTMVVKRKNRPGGQDFERWLEYEATGFYYIDAGFGTSPYAVAARFDPGAHFHSRKSVVVSGTVRLNGSPDDPANPAHAPEFVPSSVWPQMISVFADTFLAYGSRLPDSDPDYERRKVHVQFVGYAGASRLEIEKDADLAYMDGVVPTASWETERESHVAYRAGRIGKSGWGVKDGGFLCGNLVTLAQITAGRPDAYDLSYTAPDGSRSGGLVVITDAATPGVYWSNGRVFTNGTATAGPDPLGWTTAKWETSYGPGDPGNPVITETSPKNFEKTSGIASWDCAAYSTETATGDQLAAYVVASVGSSAQVTFGLATAIPTAPDGWESSQANITGVYQAGENLFPIVDGSAGGYFAYGLVRLKVGDRVLVRKIGATITVELNGSPLGALTTTAANVTRRGMVLLNNVGAKVNEMRWRVLS